MKILIICFFLLSGCNTYSSKFQCSIAKGMPCTPMHKINEMIADGSIAYIYIDQKQQRKFKLAK
jgi:hypothetical protein